MNKIWRLIHSSPLVSNRIRAALLRLIGLEIGAGSIVYNDTTFGSLKCRIGAKCFINTRCLIDGSDWVTLADGVYLAQSVHILTATHEIGPSVGRAGVPRTAPVSIGRGSWLGASSVVLPGVSIAAGCVIAAGAVVTRDTAPDGLYAGVPARRIRDLPMQSSPCGSAAA